MNGMLESRTTGERNIPKNDVRTYLRPKEAWQYLGIGRSSFYAMQNPGCKQYDASFPVSYQISKRARVWSLSELSEWVEQRVINKSAGGA